MADLGEVNAAMAKAGGSASRRQTEALLGALRAFVCANEDPKMSPNLQVDAADDLAPLIGVLAHPQIEDNEDLLEILAPSLTSIGSQLQIRRSYDLHTIDFSSIGCVDDFVIEDHSLSDDDYYALLTALTSGC